jgi:hypothetical protein
MCRFQLKDKHTHLWEIDCGLAEAIFASKNFIRRKMKTHTNVSGHAQTPVAETKWMTESEES